MLLSDFDYLLPDHAIARHPPAERDGACLLVLERSSGRVSHRRFVELPEILGAGDHLVLNDTKVLPARLFGHKDTGGRVEVLLVAPTAEAGVWRAMVAASKRPKVGNRILLDRDPSTVLRVVAEEGEGVVRLELPEHGLRLAERLGEIPLPPYLGRAAEPADLERYQTVFADPAHTGSVAAPTAGLHFTAPLLGELEARGIAHSKLTLDVGPGTFLPVRGDSIEQHPMHAESYQLGAEAADRIAGARARGGRVVAVGTTVVRVLETVGLPIEAAEGSTALFIKPGFEFQVVDVLVTNFHLPRSTLLMLVAAFAGREAVLSAYQEAIGEGYRFYSYGDAMVIR